MDQQLQQGCSRGPRAERHSLANRKLASSFFHWSINERQTHLVGHLDLALPPPPLFLVWPRPLPATDRKWEEHLVAKQRQRAPFSASYLAVPHSSLSPSSLLFGYSTIPLPPSLGFCFFSPRGSVCVSNRATETAGLRKEWE